MTEDANGFWVTIEAVRELHRRKDCIKIHFIWNEKLRHHKNYFISYNFLMHVEKIKS